MITRRRIPLSPHATKLDVDEAVAMHTALDSGIRELVRRTQIPREKMAVLLIHPDLNERRQFAERLRRAGLRETIEHVENEATIVVTWRERLRQAFGAGSVVAKFVVETDPDALPFVYALPGARERRYLCVAHRGLPVPRGSA